MGALLFFLGGKKHSVPYDSRHLLKCPVINFIFAFAAISSSNLVISTLAFCRAENTLTWVLQNHRTRDQWIDRSNCTKQYLISCQDFCGSQDLIYWPTFRLTKRFVDQFISTINRSYSFQPCISLQPTCPKDAIWHTQYHL
jgi:hypothetical protein